MPTMLPMGIASGRIKDVAKPITEHIANSIFGISKHNSMAMMNVKMPVVNQRNTIRMPANVAIVGSHQSTCQTIDLPESRNNPTYRSAIRIDNMK